MPLIGGFNALNTYRQNASLHDAQLHNVKRTSQDVIRDIARQYLTCLLDQQLVLINEKNLQLQDQQLMQISEQVALGSKAEVEQKLQEYQVKNANLLLLRSRNTLRNDLATLAQTLQIDPAINFQVQEPGWTLATLDDLSMDNLYTIAEKKRSDLERTRQNERASEFGYRAQKGNYFPSVSLFASYGSAYNYVYRNEIFKPDNRTFSQQFTEDNTQLTYGLSFQIPLHGAFRTRSTVVRNRMLYENAKLETENRELLVKSEVLLAYQNLKDAQATLEAANSQYEAAEVSYGLEKERYDLGISDIVALTQAAQSYTKAQGDLASARYTLLFQQLLVNYATGVLQAEDIP
jgi:outer membrane protein